MDDVYKNNYNNFNNINLNNNISRYIPYAEYLLMDYPQNNLQSMGPFLNPTNIYNPQIQTIQNLKKTNTNENHNVMKVETDMDLIQDLTGIYLDINNDETISEEKSEKKEIVINLGKIVVDNNYLQNFPMINVKNIDKYNISVSESILNKGEFFTAIKENKGEDINEVEMINEDKTKIVIPDYYLIDINENIKNNITQFMSKNEIIMCLKNKQLMLKNIIEKIYEKCTNYIIEIKRNVKNRIKKIKSINLSNQLLSLIKFHNELILLFLSTQDNNINTINNINQIDENVSDNPPFITYAQYFLQNCGKTFKCEICQKMFANYQTLGGHMSKIHPNCSEKYKKQNNIRKQREGQRKLLDLVKEKLFEKYKLNYRLLKKNDEKEKIKSFIKAHQKEYEILRRKMYRENALKKEE